MFCLGAGCASEPAGLTAVFYTVERGVAVQGELHTLWIEMLDPATFEPIEPSGQTTRRLDLEQHPLPLTGLILPGDEYRTEVLIGASAVRFGETVARARELAAFEPGEIILLRLVLLPRGADADADVDADELTPEQAPEAEGKGSEANAENADADACEPRTCAEQGLACGEHTDACGEPLDCGECPEDRFCTDDGRCLCHFAQCQGQCCEMGQICEASDGPCCTPNSCGGLGLDCGDAPDGCGHELFCGDCGDHASCLDGHCECDNVECGAACCGVDEVCHEAACCARQCDARCDGRPDGCGGTCDACPDGEVCASGYCLECGEAGEPCCEFGGCAWGHGCGAISGLCKPIALLRLSQAEPTSRNCGDPDYEPRGYWTTEPGQEDGADEAVDNLKDNRLDAGWVLLCSLDGRVTAQIGADDCGISNPGCPAGMDPRGRWHVGTADCGGTKHAVGAGGGTLKSGWLNLCVKQGTEAKVELGINTCGPAGPHCGGWLKAGGWHLGFGCEGGHRIVGDSGQETDDGWVDLCLLTAD